jgi:hypothetical protein
MESERALGDCSASSSPRRSASASTLSDFAPGERPLKAVSLARLSGVESIGSISATPSMKSRIGCRALAE